MSSSRSSDDLILLANYHIQHPEQTAPTTLLHWWLAPHTFTQSYSVSSYSTQPPSASLCTAQWSTVVGLDQPLSATAVVEPVPASIPVLHGPMAPLFSCATHPQYITILWCGRGAPRWVTPQPLPKPTAMSLSQARKWLTKPGEAVQTHIAQLLWKSMVWFLLTDIPGLLSIYLVWCGGRLLGVHGLANVDLKDWHQGVLLFAHKWGAKDLLHLSQHFLFDFYK